MDATKHSDEKVEIKQKTVECVHHVMVTWMSLYNHVLIIILIKIKMDNNFKEPSLFLKTFSLLLCSYDDKLNAIFALL